VIDLDELVRIGRETPAYHTDDDCLDCDAAAGQPCAVDCNHRGGEARQAVKERIADLGDVEFRDLLDAARHRRGFDKEAPGFSWAWLAIEDEVEERGLIPVE
jgi:hypothetical protein